MTEPDNTTLRIIDANLNRAREALRVMEEYARFGLNDAGLSAAIKEVRHALARAAVDLEKNGGIAGGRERAGTPDKSGFQSGAGSPNDQSTASMPRGSLIAHRNIVGDVGREIATESEYERSDIAGVAIAAAKRLSEALRAIEEYGKTVDQSFAATVEQLRYQGYELERRLALVARAQDRFEGVRLYVLLTEALCAGEWFDTAKAALDGGADCIQLREKKLSDRELLDRARRLAVLCRERGALFIVNDRPDIALLAGAHGVHLGQGDLSVSDARRIMPSTMLVGVSTHTDDQIMAAAAEAPDYIAVGPMFASPTKPQDYIAGPTALASARQHTSIPLVAIGGINEGNASEVLCAARCCICSCAAIISQSDVAQAASRLRAIVDQTAGNVGASG